MQRHVAQYRRRHEFGGICTLVEGGVSALWLETHTRHDSVWQTYLFFAAAAEPGAGPGFPFFLAGCSTVGVDLGVVLTPLAVLPTALMLLTERSIAGAPAAVGAFSTLRRLAGAAAVVPLAMIPRPVVLCSCAASAAAFRAVFPVCALFAGRSSKSESSWLLLLRFVFLASRLASPLAAAMSPSWTAWAAAARLLVAATSLLARSCCAEVFCFFVRFSAYAQ